MYRMTPADHKSTAPESYLWGKDVVSTRMHATCPCARRGEHKSSARRGEHSQARGEHKSSARPRPKAPLAPRSQGNQRLIKFNQGSAYPLFLSTSGAT